MRFLNIVFSLIFYFCCYLFKSLPSANFRFTPFYFYYLFLNVSPAIALGFLNIMQAFESCKFSLEASPYVFSTNSESITSFSFSLRHYLVCFVTYSLQKLCLTFSIKK